MTPSVPAMPVMPAPPGVGTNLLVNVLIVLALLAWWGLSAERGRGPIVPLLLLGTGLSAVIVEPVFDNTIMYWWPAENPYALFTSYGRTIPWSAILGYAWFFGGSSYVLWRLFERGVTVLQSVRYYIALSFVDWLAMSIAEWTDQSAFYGDQPFHFFGSPLWFSFVDAAGAFALGAALYALLPHLTGARKWLLPFLPTFIYGGVLGSTTAPIAQALHSGWSTMTLWLSGAATIGLCWGLVYVVSRILAGVSR